jgi:hypothetical protein
MASSSADDAGLFRALSAFATLRIGGIAIWPVEIELSKIEGILSMIGGRKWPGPAKGHGENGKGLMPRECDEGVIVVQSCSEGLCCTVGKPSFALFSLEASFGDCELEDMAMMGSFGFGVEFGFIDYGSEPMGVEHF